MFLNIFTILITILFSASPVKAEKFLPPEGKVLFMIGQDKDTIDQYSTQVDVPAGVMLYTSIQELDGILSAVDRGAGTQDGGYLLKEYPESVVQIGLYMVGALEGVITGDYDDNIKALGEWIIKADRPIFLRIGYEFDLPENHYDPHTYAKAYRYIVDKFKQMNITNVAYVWHSHGYLYPDKPIMEWYPGDDYVDWVAVSFFSPYNNGNLRIISKIAAEHSKPLMIAEATPYGMSTNDGEKVWNRWYKRFFDFIEQNDVKIVCYINAYWDSQPMWSSKGWGDARIQNHFFIEEQWLKRVRNQKKSLEPSVRLFMKLENGDEG